MKALRTESEIRFAEEALGRRVSGLLGTPVSHASVVLLRTRMLSLRDRMPPVVVSSVVKSVCNAWTTSGRFSGPNLPCPFGCRTEGGDKWAHFAACTAIRGMWRQACPSANRIFNNLTLERVLMLCPGLTSEAVLEVALWVDVVGHLSYDMRALGMSPMRTLLEGEDMMSARLRQLALQSEEARAVIRAIRVAVHISVLIN